VGRTTTTSKLLGDVVRRRRQRNWRGRVLTITTAGIVFIFALTNQQRERERDTLVRHFGVMRGDALRDTKNKWEMIK
jgi:hypothetical protein